ncbi:hypothetical protein LTR53_004485 [Teratosphaeriaceae sp. CCFEE 6253]|nr:hypothetical protein LTR53_004485 [Teratosphaeriaceae sp. CCFEE 6253]
MGSSSPLRSVLRPSDADEETLRKAADILGLPLSALKQLQSAQTSEPPQLSHAPPGQHPRWVPHGQQTHDAPAIHQSRPTRHVPLPFECHASGRPSYVPRYSTSDLFAEPSPWPARISDQYLDVSFPGGHGSSVAVGSGLPQHECLTMGFMPSVPYPPEGAHGETALKSNSAMFAVADLQTILSNTSDGPASWSHLSEQSPSYTMLPVGDFRWLPTTLSWPDTAFSSGPSQVFGKPEPHQSAGGFADDGGLGTSTYEATSYNNIDEVLDLLSESQAFHDTPGVATTAERPALRKRALSGLDQPNDERSSEHAPIVTACSSPPGHIGSRRRLDDAAPNSTFHSAMPKVRKRKGRLGEKQRHETALTRRNVACVRCRQQRNKVCERGHILVYMPRQQLIQVQCIPDILDPHGMCITCQSISGKLLIRLPCLRYKIADAQLLDVGAHPRFAWTRRWTDMRVVDIAAWASPEIKTISLTQDVGGACYNLHVRQVLPIDGDAFDRSWTTNGIEHTIACAPYAIADMRQTGKDLVAFVDQNMESFILHCTDETDRLLRNTYSMAYRHMNIVERASEKRLLRCVLTLWVASRMGSRQDRIAGEESLGMGIQDWDPEARNFGIIVVPPIVSAQLDLIHASMILLPMKKEVLRLLNDLIINYETKSWFTIYLATFMLMHSCALLTQAEAKRAKRHVSAGNQKRFYNTQLVEELHNGAKIMLAHFHYCNKGSHPFDMDWTDVRNTSFARLDKEQAMFLKETNEDVAAKGERFRYVRDHRLFEDEYYFVAQLYERDWVPTATI